MTNNPLESQIYSGDVTALKNEYSRKRIRFIPWLLSASLLLFMAQPWSPQLIEIPLHVVIVWFLFLWIFIFYGKGFRNSLLVFTPFQWLMISILAVSIMASSFVSGLKNIVQLGQFLTGVMLAIISTFCFMNAKSKVIILSLALGVSINSGLALLQYLNVSPLLWQFSKYVNQGYVYGSVGFESSPVSYAYSIIGTGMLLIGSSAIYWKYKKRIIPVQSTVLFAFSFLVIVGLFVSNSRSGMLGILLGAVILMVNLRNNRIKIALNKLPRNQVIALNFFLFTAFLVLIFSILMYALTIRESSALSDSRIFETWKMYIPVIFKYPFGLPGGVDLMTAADVQYTGSEKIIAPHNLLLSTGVAYGVTAAVALFMLYFNLLIRGYRTFEAYKKAGLMADAFWILLLVAVNSAIICHSWFHNASIAMGEMRNWFWVGLLAQAVQKQRKSEFLYRMRA